MQITVLTDEMLQPTLAYLRHKPYRNALLLSNLSQLRERCDVLLARDGEQLIGVASTYHDLPAPNLIFTATSNAAAPALIKQLAARNPGLQYTTMALLPETQFDQLQNAAILISHEIEFQMVVEPETLRIPEQSHVTRLTHAELPALNELAEVAGLTVWHEGALDLGPAFGCFAEKRLVAMAATHFITPEIIEIGHVATHPAYRGRGYAKAATAAVAQAAFALAPHVFLMVLEQNTAAQAAYRSIGFYPIERFYLARFQVDVS